MLSTKRKNRDESWDFRGAFTKYHVHCFHNYPAMMIPQIAGRILDELAAGARLLLDPYCGTGTSLVEANIRGIDAIGFDINPLALLIARAKTNPPRLEQARIYTEAYLEFVGRTMSLEHEHIEHAPRFKNIDYWFKKETVFQLAAIRRFISQIEDMRTRDFFLVAFSETVREVSLTRNGEFKLYRMDQEQISRFEPNAYEVMAEKLERNLKGLEEYLSVLPRAVETRVIEFNTVESSPVGVLGSRQVDIVVTSPPYGDSRTTVAYGQFSRLSNQWLGLHQHNDVDRTCMGGRRVTHFCTMGIPPVDETVHAISTLDRNRALEVLSFYLDYAKSISNVSEAVRPGGLVAYVVGNRKVKGIEIPNDEITSALFEKSGFIHEETVVREIPSKRMPKRNSPSNVAGVTDNTMHYEYIVICRKR